MSTSHTDMKSDIATFASMTLPQFAEWLRSQPSDRIYAGGRQTRVCPIACYTGFASAAYLEGMPEWASRFINIFDDEFEAPRTQAHALLALARIEAEMKAALESDDHETLSK